MDAWKAKEETAKEEAERAKADAVMALESGRLAQQDADTAHVAKCAAEDTVGVSNNTKLVLEILNHNIQHGVIWDGGGCGGLSDCPNAAGWI